MLNFNYDFHQRNEMICTAELNNHSQFFLMWQKPKTEATYGADVLRLKFQVTLIQNAGCIFKLCVCMCVYVVINSALPTEQTVNRSEYEMSMFFPSYSDITSSPFTDISLWCFVRGS